MTVDRSHWQQRLTALARTYGLVGASLSIAQGDTRVDATTGVLNVRTGQPVTPDSVFQAGSITKVWTATLVMQLVDDGLVDLDAPVITYLPSFRVADEQLTKTVTVRQLLSHTSGIDGDLFLDTGRGDDCLAHYVAAMSDLTETVPRGRVMSYGNSGYCLLGHLVATLRGRVFETVLRQRLLVPLGLESSGMLPEEALLWGAATGHVLTPDHGALAVAPQWGLYRSIGPAGLLHGTAAAQVAFARSHLAGGVTPDGTRLLSAASTYAMQQPHVAIPDRWLLGTHWGLGWILSTWGDEPVFGHDGNTIGQAAFLRVLPQQDLTIALMTNGGRAPRDLFMHLFSEIATALAGVAPEPLPQPRQYVADPARFTGTYARQGMRYDIAQVDGALTMTTTSSLPLAPPPFSAPLLPHSENVLLLKTPAADSLAPVVFFDLDGDRYLHTNARTTRRQRT